MAGGTKSKRGRRRRTEPTVPTRRSGAVSFALLFAAFAGAALIVLAPALRGPFVSDDLEYVPNNPYVTGFSLALLDDVFDPRGEPVAIEENYTPVHLLFHAAAWRAFGPNVVGHHVLNVLLHALATALLVPLLRRSGVPTAAAVLGGAFFLLHPANVEAAAWISQVKSTASLSFALLALLALERRPALATACFAAALLAKPTSAFALPVALLFTWTRLRGDVARRSFLWLGVWGALFAMYAVVEMLAFTHAVSGVAAIHPDPFVRLRTSIGFVARYFVMAVSSLGVSAFHEPPAALSPFDPWWLAGLGVLVVLGARAILALRARQEEAAYWLWAVVAFLPVAQIWPFSFPLADRYLYPILPGLIGGFLLWGAALAKRFGWGTAVAARFGPRTRVALSVVFAVPLLLGFGARAHARARLWGVPALLMADAAANYPDGVNAHLRRAGQAMEQGDRVAAIAALRGAADRGYERFEQLLANPRFAPLQGDPAFSALIADMAGRWVKRLGPLPDPAQSELFSLGVAHRLRGERDSARRAFERGLAMDGPLHDALATELRELDR